VVSGRCKQNTYLIEPNLVQEQARFCENKAKRRRRVTVLVRAKSYKQCEHITAKKLLLSSIGDMDELLKSRRLSVEIP